jgi:hypothetical protein
MTPTENKTLVQNIMQAWSRRDHPPFVAAMADDFVRRIIGSTAWSGEYVGKTEVRERLLKPLHQRFATHRPSRRREFWLTEITLPSSAKAMRRQFPASDMPTPAASSSASRKGSYAR